MVQQQLDRTLSAIADPTRRDILARLGGGSATISELARPYGISLTGLKKHVHVLERAGLVSTEKVGRARRCTLEPGELGEVERWIESYREMVETRLDRLAELIEQPEQESDDDR